MFQQEADAMPEMRVTTSDNELSLREMSEALPDTATIMTRVGECWWHLIYAARGGNWELAGYYFRRVVKLENTLVVLRPKHKERMAKFQAEAVPPVEAALDACDLAKLEDAYAAATDMANRLHGESGYPYVQWVLPEEPPRGLNLGPVTDVVAADAADNGHRSDSGR